MIHPSYVDLMNVVNEGAEEGEAPIVNSRYAIVMATAKRARQLVDGDEPLVEDAAGRKPLSVAVEELEQGLLKILPQDQEELLISEEAEYEAARALESSLTEEALQEAEDSWSGKVTAESGEESAEEHS